MENLNKQEFLIELKDAKILRIDDDSVIGGSGYCETCWSEEIENEFEFVVDGGQNFTFYASIARVIPYLLNNIDKFKDMTLEEFHDAIKDKEW